MNELTAHLSQHKLGTIENGAKHQIPVSFRAWNHYMCSLMDSEHMGSTEAKTGKNVFQNNSVCYYLWNMLIWLVNSFMNCVILLRDYRSLPIHHDDYEAVLQRHGLRHVTCCKSKYQEYYFYLSTIAASTNHVICCLATSSLNTIPKYGSLLFNVGHLKWKMAVGAIEIQQYCKFQVKIIIFSRMSNNEWQENEREIDVCLGKLPLFIHVSSQSCVWGEGLLWKK